MKKLTYAAMLSETDASEEFREGVIKCFRAFIGRLSPCFNEGCACREIRCLPALLENGDMMPPLFGTLSYDGGGECLLSFFRSRTAAAAVGHWLSLLLKVCI